MDYYNERQLLTELRSSVETSKAALNVAALEEEIQTLRESQHAEDYWKDVERAGIDNRKIAALEKTLSSVTSLSKRLDDTEELINLAEEMDDDATGAEAAALLPALKTAAEELFLQTLLTGKYDANNAILSLHAGAGGTEAQDWAEMLYRMYTRYAERAGYQISLIDYQQGDEAGIKSVTFQLNGNNAYGFLKAEKGVHRLVRISPFDANKRRHTSFASLEVMPEILDSGEIVIKPEDLKIDTCRSSGAGGQHVNKTESAVRITHIPTGIVTWCQNERSQVQNRETAMRMLVSKLTELKEREQMETEQAIKGELKKIEWGSQIRSYVFCPYTLVKDHRTGFESSNIAAVMDGDIEPFIREYLIKSH